MEKIYKKVRVLQWFTLVELIIVITILAILATIAFISFQNFSKDARDAVRVSTLKNIETWLSLYQIKNAILPIPDASKEITASWDIISYQGVIWESVSKNIWLNQISQDPKYQDSYLYTTTENRKKYQLLFFKEWNTTAFENQKTYASYNLLRTPVVSWNNIWTILNYDNSLITDDVETTTWTTQYNIVFNNSQMYTLSGSLITSIILYTKDKNLVKYDKNLVWYYDMETLTMSWNQLLLKDLSIYENDGICYDGNGKNVDCDWRGWWPKVVNIDWWNGKVMSFDWINDFISVPIRNKYYFDDWKITLITRTRLNSICEVFVDGDPCLDTIVFKWGAFNPWFWLIANYFKKYVIEINGNAWWYNYYFNPAHQKDEFENIVFIKNNDLNIWYVNWGLHSTKNTNYNLLNNDSNLSIWSYLNIANRVFDWYIDEIFIFNRDFSEIEAKIANDALK